MRFSFLTLFLSLLSLALATQTAAPQKSIVVSYPSDTPGWVLDKAKEAIKQAGGRITHEYSIIKGFAATAPESIFETVKTLGDKYIANIEEDQIVTIQ